MTTKYAFIFFMPNKEKALFILLAKRFFNTARFLFAISGYIKRSQPTSELYRRYYSFEDAAPWHHSQAFPFGLRKLALFPAWNERFKPRVIHREGRPWRGFPPLPVQKSPGKKTSTRYDRGMLGVWFPFSRRLVSKRNVYVHRPQKKAVSFTIPSFAGESCRFNTRKSRRVPGNSSQCASIPYHYA